MFNPAYPFTSELLDSFVAKEVRYFVRSTYPRGISNLVHEAFLISQYHTLSDAEQHYNAIRKDNNRGLYDIEKAEDLTQLRNETVAHDHKQTFSKLIHPENEKRANAHFKENTKRYLKRNTNWNLDSKGGKVTIYPKFRYQFGELYVRIYHEGDEIIVKFEDIENS